MIKRARLSFIALLGFMLLTPAFSYETFAQAGKAGQTGCAGLDKSKPPLFISYEQPVDKAWAGNKYARGVLLRLNNNSNCAISFSAAYGESPRVPPNFVIRNGKLVRQPDVRIGSLTNGQQVSLEYLIKYPDRKHPVVGGFGGDMLETVWLNGGDYIFFSVPLSDFKKSGQLLLQYSYDWDNGDASQIVTEKNGYKQRRETVEHYLRFDPQRLPVEILK
jgi:hypothetical protein